MKVHYRHIGCRAFWITLCMFVAAVQTNQPPFFELDGDQQSEVVLRLKEGSETPVGTLVYQVRASDPDADPLQFALQGSAANELLAIEPVDATHANLVLKKLLDREVQDEYSFVLTLTDGRSGLADSIKLSLLILVEDVNDNEPVFQPFPNTIFVQENGDPDVILTLEATDRDQGAYGQVVYSLEGQDNVPFAIATVGGQGILRTLTSLDYEQNSLYQLRILAKDRASEGRVNTATAALLIRVVDVEDQDPEFIAFPSITRVSEDTQPGTIIMKVKAIDGDRGVNNRISYSLLTDHREFFDIDADKGTVLVKSKLDRENPLVSNGAYILTILATEDSKLEPKPSTVTEVTVLVMDVNDEAPRFRSQLYEAEIDENSPVNMPVSFVKQSNVAQVFDYDQGSNGTFQLSVECDEDLFDISPNLVVNEAIFSLRVKNQEALDFERLKRTNCTVVAREVVSWQPKSSRVTVIVSIRDTNDNLPQFNRSFYQVRIPENAPTGTTVAWIQATDQDSGLFGTAGIRYTSLQGSTADRLKIDPITGMISVASGGANIFDREKIGEFIVIVEAKDFLGAGNRNTVQLHVLLDDVNDNAPVFIQSHFEIYINENENKFPYRFRLEAFDRDLNGSRNSEIVYSIVEGNEDGNFSIQATSGEIQVAHPLDFELVPPNTLDSGSLYNGLGHVRKMNLVVRATDMGSPPLWTNVAVLIFVHDVNDFAPVFTSPLYATNVSEDIAPGSSVLQVRAVDHDGSSPNNLIVYRIQSGGLDKFVIDSTSGMISIANGASLDPDRTDPRTTRYQLEILALDGGLGSNQFHTKTIVNIAVNDVNNKAPILSKLETVYVPENLPTGSVLTQISARDVDDRPVLHYSIDYSASEARNEDGSLTRDSERHGASCFEISADGKIRLIRQLDRERAETVRLAIRVEDKAAVSGNQTASGTVTIIIEDINDNDPVFSQPFYRRSVPENSKRGTPILTLSADDADKNRSLTYSLDGPLEMKELVHLDSLSGEMVVAGKIDRERHAWINLTARASDSGTPMRTSLVPVFIQVLDENDNNPQFFSVPSNWSVKENAPLGTVIGAVEAHDADAGDFGHITYLLDRRSSKGIFSIDPETGTITVMDQLDREEQNTFTLVLEAWDNYKFGYAAGESRNAFHQVTISILDENDEPPVFQPLVGCASVTEFHDPRVAITTIQATDNDDPATPNGKIVFTIESGNDLDLFGIVNVDFLSARIFAMKPLVRHHDNYTLRIRAQDRGFPINTAYQDVHICVTDFNDHAPRFVRPEQNTTIKVAENETVGFLIAVVAAVDEDAGLNSQIRYSLRPDPLGHWKTFAIDELSGDITLAQPLDREMQKLYEIRIQAHDLGVPTSLTSDLDLVVYVKDVNDFPPQFEVDSIQANFTEHRVTALQSIKLPDTIDRDDPDDLSGPKDPVCYFIVHGNGKGFFALDRLRHTLQVVKELDREEESIHLLLIRASEDCESIPPEIDFFDPADDTVLKVVINVGDINDNRPQFVKDVFMGGFTAEANFGAEILRIRAVDADAGLNARLSYFIVEEITTGTVDGMENFGSNPFVIDQETGAISLNFDPQRQMKGYFVLKVLVNDTGGLSDTARVYIYLLREDQRVKFVLRQQPQQLRSRIDLFQDVLGNITRAIVNVDEVKIHSNELGVVDKTRTDVFMHFVHPGDNSILEVDNVLRLIDANIELLNDLFKEFNVLDTSPAEPFRESSDMLPHLSLFWASGTAVFLAVILLLVLGLCISQRMVLMRKLKAASVTAFGSHETSLTGTNRVPGTNQHSVEGSNPIWRRELESDWFKQQDLFRSTETDGLESLDVNAILGNETGTPRHSNSNGSDANTASLNSTTETFNRALVRRNLLPASLTPTSLECNSSLKDDPMINDVTISEKECEVDEVKDEDTTVNGMGVTYQRNVYHFGYPVFQDKNGVPLVPRKLETTEL